MRVPTPSPRLKMPAELALSESERGEGMTDSLEAQFQPMDDAPEQTDTGMAHERMHASEYAPGRKEKLVSHRESYRPSSDSKLARLRARTVHQTVSWDTYPSAITFLTIVFKAVVRRQYFPPAWKHARLVSIQKPRKKSMLPSDALRLHDTVGKPFQQILLTRVLQEVNEHGLLRDEQYGFPTREHEAAARPPYWKRQEKLWWEAADRRGLPACG
jgi:hypothetical protein